MGKSMIAMRFFRDHMPWIDETTGDMQMPVLLIDMTEITTPRRFYRQILEELGVPTAKQQSLDTLADLAFKLLRRVSVRLLIADEIQDILAGTARQQRGCLNLLKLLSNRLQISIVALGVQEAAIAIAVDPQMSSRFPRIDIPLWREDNSFWGLLDAFERILPLRKPSKINTKSAGKFLLNKAGGTTGGIVSLITDAAVHAIRSRSERVDESCLRESAESMRSMEVPA
jgi:RNAse (barnase) inhibitor barstar